MYAPICTGMIHPADRTIDIPAPPCSTGRARNPGNQKNRPQFANCTQADSNVARIVRPRNSGPKSTANAFRPFALDALRCPKKGEGPLSEPLAKSERRVFFEAQTIM